MANTKYKNECFNAPDIMKDSRESFKPFICIVTHGATKLKVIDSNVSLCQTIESTMEKRYVYNDCKQSKAANLQNLESKKCSCSFT